MNFKVDPKIFTNFASPRIGVVVARGIDNSGSDPEIASLLRQVEERVKADLNIEELSDHPQIACWREAYRKFGSKPRDFRCSIEALCRVVLRGSNIRNINKLVDLYNLISLKYILPVGGEDLDKMKGDLVLGFAKGDEDYTPLDGEENDPPGMGEVIYKDDIGVICRRWNWREGDRTKLSNETKNAILVIETLDPVSKGQLENALQELADLVKKYCGGSTDVYILEEGNPQVLI